MGKRLILGSLALLFAAFSILPMRSLAQNEQPPPEGAAGAPTEGEGAQPPGDEEAPAGQPEAAPEEQGAPPPPGDEEAPADQPAAAQEEQGAPPPPGDEGAPEGQPGAPPEEQAAQPQGAEGAPAEDNGPTLEELEKQMSPEEFDKLTDTGEPMTFEPGEVPQPLPTPAPDEQAAPEPTSPPGTTPANITSEAEMRQGMLAAHARARAAVGAAPLSWSPALAAHAQEWADHLKQSGCNMEHRSGQHEKGYGENLFWAGGRSSSEGANEQIDVSPGSVVQGWDDEKSDYNAATHTCAAGKACGHYTQVVWKSTTEVGCAMAVCDDKSQVWVCNYNPPGNYSGQTPF